jgi:hypothetical protein
MAWRQLPEATKVNCKIDYKMSKCIEITQSWQGVQIKAVRLESDLRVPETTNITVPELLKRIKDELKQLKKRLGLSFKVYYRKPCRKNCSRYPQAHNKRS